MKWEAEKEFEAFLADAIKNLDDGKIPEPGWKIHEFDQGKEYILKMVNGPSFAVRNQRHHQMAGIKYSTFDGHIKELEIELIKKKHQIIVSQREWIMTPDVPVEQWFNHCLAATYNTFRGNLANLQLADAISDPDTKTITSLAIAQSFITAVEQMMRKDAKSRGFFEAVRRCEIGPPHMDKVSMDFEQTHEKGVLTTVHLVCEGSVAPPSKKKPKTYIDAQFLPLNSQLNVPELIKMFQKRFQEAGVII